MPPRQEKTKARPSFAWLGQAVSGLLLIAIFGLHIYFQHFQARGLLNAGEVIAHVASPVIFGLEILFVIVITYHALLGIRAIIFDLSLAEATRRKVTTGLTILGILTAGYGLMLAILIRSQLAG
jgi:succinate dehydrogenase hydrophobic anchor subunit